MSRERNRWLSAYALVVYAFLFAPIVVLIIFSFNKARRGLVWQGFTTDWYPKLFSNRQLTDALFVTLEVAVVAVLVSTVLGSLLGLGLARVRFRGRGATETLLLVPMVTPEIVMGLRCCCSSCSCSAPTGRWPSCGSPTSRSASRTSRSSSARGRRR